MSGTYKDQLTAKCAEIQSTNPKVKEIVDAVLKINSMSNMEFDYNIEKTYLMYKAVNDLLPQDTEA